MAGTAIPIPSVNLIGCEKPMPLIIFGTAAFPVADQPETVKAAVLEGIKAGYSHFDSTAFVYGSEKQLGEAVAEATRLGLIKSKHELFITTKLWVCFTEPSQVVPACKMSLQNLGLEYVDLYLIHQPLRITEMIKGMPVAAEIIRPLDVKGVWEGMEECKNLGLTKAIGVSNFSPKKLDQLLSTAKIPPAVNQVELNPAWQQNTLIDYCREKGIHITAYAPLGANNTQLEDGKIVENEVLAHIANARGKTIAQVALRWVYEQGVSIAPKSFNKERMKQYLDIFDWALTPDDLEKISKIPQRKGVRLANIWGAHDLILELDAEL